jgi:hypothetical protein
LTDSDSSRKTPLDIVRIHFPWNVAPDVVDAEPYLSMRAYGDWVATGGNGLPEATLKRARELVQLLRQNDAVLEYDPTLPAAAGLSDRGGFALRDRTPADDDLLVRANDHTNLTVEGRMIWRFQHVDP